MRLKGRYGFFQITCVVVLAYFIVLEGCAPTQFTTRRGTYHTVETGETLWRICYAYKVNMESVCRFNGIRDPEHIRVGDKLFIPGVSKARRVGPAKFEKPANRATNANKAFHKENRTAVKRPSTVKAKSQKTSLKFDWPVKGSVTSWFGIRKGRRHDGIDIAAPKGTSIRAAEKGKVIYSGNGISGYGNLIIIQHSEGFNSVYAHNSRNLVQVDETVEKRQVIGRVGKTGRATGYHLHFEVRRGVRSVDPMHYLP